MAIFRGGMFAPAAVAVGDIWVRNDGQQQRVASIGPNVWEQLQPSETRADILPGGPDPDPNRIRGTQDQVLVRLVDVQPFTVAWRNPGAGMIWEDDFTNSDIWFCNHNLRNRFVSVLAVKNDGTIMIPDIDYAGANINSITLRFEDNVSGTAVIRR